MCLVHLNIEIVACALKNDLTLSKKEAKAPKQGKKHKRSDLTYLKSLPSISLKPWINHDRITHVCG